MVAVVLAAVWGLGRGRLPPAEAVIRSRSFLWPALETILGWPWPEPWRWRPGAGADAIVTSGGGFSSPVRRWRRSCTLRDRLPGELGCPPRVLEPHLPADHAGRGGAAPGGGGRGRRFRGQACHTPPTLGILPNANVAYGVHELAVYDPMVPRAYFRTWQQLTGRRATTAGAPLVFCPALDTATLARRYGVEFVLVPGGATAPRGHGLGPTRR